MQAPKIKTFKNSINTFLTLATLFILLGELYLAYTFVYKNLAVAVEPTSNDKIVRVDTASYKTTIDLLNGLKIYIPSYSIPVNTNPLK